MSYEKELSEKIKRVRENIKDWERIKSENPFNGGYYDLQLAYEGNRLEKLEIEEQEYVEDMAMEYYENMAHGHPDWD